MSFAGTAIVGSSLLGGYFSGQASKEAAEIESRTAMEALKEQQRQFDIATLQLQPYFSDPMSVGVLKGAANPFGQGGNQAAMEILDFLGIGRGWNDTSYGLSDRQQTAIKRLEQSPAFQEKIRAGEEAILSRASATGGLRGGNVQAALAQFRPALLSEEIDRRVAQLGGLAGTTSEQALQSLQLGGAAAARQSASALQFGQNIGETFGRIGQAQGQRALSGTSGMLGQAFSAVPSMIGTYQGITGQKLFG